MKINFQTNFNSFLIGIPIIKKEILCSVGEERKKISFRHSKFVYYKTKNAYVLGIASLYLWDFGTVSGAHSRSLVVVLLVLEPPLWVLLQASHTV